MKCLWPLVLLCALPVHAAEHRLEIEPEVQRHSQLCWAAVSVMATRAFPQSATFRPATQEETVIYQRAGFGTLAASGAAEPPEVVTARAACGVDYANCNEVGQPYLLGLARARINKLHPGAKLMLTPGHFTIDIVQRKAPIIIRWFYTDTRDGDAESEPDVRFGMHSLIVTGYDDVTKWIRIWDPWPAHGEVEPAGHVRHKWIRMSRYEHPINDEGHSVKAAHGFDEFAIRLRGQPIDSGYPNLKEITEVPVNPPDPVAIPDGPPDVRQAIRDFMGRIEVRAEDGLVLRGPFQAGDPIPILAMKSAAIDRERAQPERLFQPQSSAMMVPVFKDGILVDSFLLLNRHGGWIEDGYSNNEIARLMVNLRNNRKSPERPEAGFYLVSIPEEGSFFAGHGFRNRANLISLDNGAMGDFIPARQALEALHKQIDRRKSGTRGEVRPR